MNVAILGCGGFATSTSYACFVGARVSRLIAPNFKEMRVTSRKDILRRQAHIVTLRPIETVLG